MVIDSHEALEAIAAYTAGSEAALESSRKLNEAWRHYCALHRRSDSIACANSAGNLYSAAGVAFGLGRGDESPWNWRFMGARECTTQEFQLRGSPRKPAPMEAAFMDPSRADHNIWQVPVYSDCLSDESACRQRKRQQTLDWIRHA